MAPSFVLSVQFMSGKLCLWHVDMILQWCLYYKQGSEPVLGVYVPSSPVPLAGDVGLIDVLGR